MEMMVLLTKATLRQSTNLQFLILLVFGEERQSDSIIPAVKVKNLVKVKA